MFYYTGNNSENLIARKKEIFDNVIPSSNAIMTENLYRLSIIFDREDLRDTHQKMMNKVKEFIKKDPEFMSYWASTATSKLSRQIEISIVGRDYIEISREISRTPRLNQVKMASEEPSKLPLMDYKTTNDGETTIYVCSEKTCRRPVTSIEAAEKELEILVGSK